MVTTITKRGVMDMKKIIAILLITIMAIGAAACQKTPESPIVVGKNNEKLIEKAITSSDTPFSAPSRYSANKPLANPQGSLTVNVDAAVIVPKSEGLSTARVGKHIFTKQNVKRMLLRCLTAKPLIPAMYLRQKHIISKLF